MSLQLRVNRRESSIQLDLTQKMEKDIDVAPAFFRVSFVFMKRCVTTERKKMSIFGNSYHNAHLV